MNFRRWITALAVLALFAGLASAQIAYSGAGGGGVFTCQANVAIPPSLRSEGLTELIGDIVITCTGGSLPTMGSALPTANFTVSLGNNVTSRLLSYNANTSTATTASNTSEALLLIDEPGSSLPGGQWNPLLNGGQGGANPLNTASGPVTGFGPNATQFLCGASGPGVAAAPLSAIGAGVGGCVEYAQQTPSPTFDYVMSGSGPGVSAAPIPAPNMFAGVVNGNQVAFYGIPIMPPASAGVARVYRITNVRLNAAALSGGNLPGTQAVYANVSISSNFSLLMTNPTPIVGFLQPGLNYAASGLRNVINNNSGGSTALQQCSNQSAGGQGSNAYILRYVENFGTAFKTRVAPTSTTSGQSGSPIPMQNVPGVMYNSESGFVTPLVSGYTQTGVLSGLADYGTRLKAVFNNVPSGVTIFVSTSNVVNLFTTTTPSGQVSAPAALTSSASYAQEVLTEGGVEGNVVTATNNVQNAALVNVLGYAPLAATATAGQYVAVWEVMNTNFATAENFDFAVYVAYTANANANLPPPTGSTPATVTLSYAPTASQGAFTTAAGIVASSSVPIPRFTDTASTPIKLFDIVPCTTNLLFPFVTSQVGFDTGIAIVNTTLDPWGTTAQQGTCDMYFYGNNQPPKFTTPIIVPGQGVNTTPALNWAFMMSQIPGVPAAGFEGYMIAICNFQLAHGYAFISDLGAQKLAHGYLALILNNGTSKRVINQGVNNIEALEN
jgi:hypothetical protein